MTGAAPQTRSVVVERELAAPPAKLWRALTEPHLVEEWLMQTDFQPVEGHRFTLRREPKPDVKVVIDCRVLEVDPPRTLSYSWAAYGLDSVVTFTLTPTETGTHLRIEQSGFPPDRQAAYKGARASWPHFVAALEQVLVRMN